MKPKGIEYDRKRTKYACFKVCQESEQMLPLCDYLKEQYRFGYICHTYSEMDKVTQSTAANAEESAAAGEELRAQSEQMKVYVGDLVAVVGGRVNGGGSGENSAGFRRERAMAHKALALLEKRAADRQLAVCGKASKKVTHPEEVIPMKEGGFKDF